MIIDVLPIWALFLATTALVLLSIEGGYRSGRLVRGKTDDERESPASSMSGIILGLQAFMLAFTFGIVSDRFDHKKGLVREEANTIRSAFHLADFLPEPGRQNAKEILRRYTDHRIRVAASHDPVVAEAALLESRQMQAEIWSIAVQYGRGDMDSDVGVLFIESIDKITNLHATRATLGLHARIPTGIWIVLIALLILGMFGVGFHTAIADSRRSRVAPVLAVAFSLVIALIAALDHPGNEILPVSQRSLVNVLSEMNEEMGAGG